MRDTAIVDRKGSVCRLLGKAMRVGTAAALAVALSPTAAWADNVEGDTPPPGQIQENSCSQCADEGFRVQLDTAIRAHAASFDADLATMGFNAYLAHLRDELGTAVAPMLEGKLAFASEVVVTYAGIVSPPTCANRGRCAIQLSFTCAHQAVNTFVFSDIEFGSAGGHSIQVVEAKPATCVDGGRSKYWYCSSCGAMFSDELGTAPTNPNDLIVPATGMHDYRDGACAVCRKLQPDVGSSSAPSPDPAPVPSTPSGSASSDTSYSHIHSFKELSATEATCTQPGLSAGVVCATCGETIVSQTQLDALGHSWSVWKTVVKPTLDAKGRKQVRCLRDGCDSFKTRSIPKLRHARVVKRGISYDCTAKGATVDAIASTASADPCAIVISAKVKVGGKWRPVAGIKRAAFKGHRACILVVKTKLLTRRSTKGSLIGSRVGAVCVKVSSSKRVNARYARAYAKCFAVANSGRKVVVA